MQFQYGGFDVHNQWQWYTDERDWFIQWLQAEFAAANAMIDALCGHLSTTSEPGEYDVVMGYINQRRYNWQNVLTMQEHYPIGEIIGALQQVAKNKQSRRFEPPKPTGKDFRKQTSGQRQVHRPEHVRENRCSSSSQYVSPGATVEKKEEEQAKGEEIKMNKNEAQLPHASASNVLPEIEESVGASSCIAECDQKDGKDTNGLTCVNLHEKGSIDASSCKAECNQKNVKDTSVSTAGDKLDFESRSDGVHLHEKVKDATSKQDGHQKPFPTPKFFECHELWNGQTVNVGDGLKLYDGLFDDSEISTLLAAANEWRISGRKGEFPGLTFVASKRPSKGHGRDTLQFGVPVAGQTLQDDNSATVSKERKVEPIPRAVLDIIYQLNCRQLMTSMPDYCIVDFFNEGDHSHPYTWQQWYGRPIYSLFLTETDMVFGQLIRSDHRGNYRGALKLSLSPGSLLVMQGSSADVVKHAIPFARKPRVILLFGKSLPMKPLSPWFPSSGGNNTALLPNHYPHHFPLPVSPAAPFVTPPTAAAVWLAASPPRPPPPGTGVFLPSAHPSDRDNGPDKPDNNHLVDPSA